MEFQKYSLIFNRIRRGAKFEIVHLPLVFLGSFIALGTKLLPAPWLQYSFAIIIISILCSLFHPSLQQRSLQYFFSNLNTSFLLMFILRDMKISQFLECGILLGFMVFTLSLLVGIIGVLLGREPVLWQSRYTNFSHDPHWKSNITSSIESGACGFDVWLWESGPSKIEIIKSVRQYVNAKYEGGLTLTAAKKLVETCPSLLASNIVLEKAVELERRLSAHGASLRIVEVGAEVI